MTTTKETESKSRPSFLYAATPYLGALLEAWHELRINRGRIMLSLVSVAAAVWAMTTVIALGNILTSSQDAVTAQSTGIAGTVTLTAGASTSDSEDGSDFGGGDFGDGTMADSFGSFGGLGIGGNGPDDLSVINPDGSINDAFSTAAHRLVETTHANLWSRVRMQPATPVQNVNACDPDDYECVSPATPELIAADPGWFDIYARTMVQGRRLEDADGQRLMNPAVVNDQFYESLGNPALADHPTFTLQETGDTTFTVVGVYKSLGSWDAPSIVTHYDSFLNAGYEGPVGEPQLLVATPEESAKENQKALHNIFQAELGPSWKVNTSLSEKDTEISQELNNTITTALGIIGGIVIALGALGLLTVSIVTIGHRVREIGIRRAMGASAGRIFISVFLESIVATTVAGVVGVIASIITVKQLPLDKMLALPLETGTVAYPVTAAVIGVLVATFVGALAGIIPATIAVRVKPIDAIRF
ncbi:FtsX-like permease family protein [uncultured Corynebacterium sp.]|uniref:ABC transporter permease n=1 Tax=uncultured Corynebacterium sp. TaxID=159447 RepID=UPI0026114EF7|nr:FtsX-like permease family protein [uncultured Corynebacterium sp.]